MFDCFHETFLLQPEVSVEGRRFAPAGMLGVVGSTDGRFPGRALLSLHWGEAQDEVLLASTDGQTITAHVWQIASVSDRYDFPYRKTHDRNHLTLHLQRHYTGAGRVVKEFAKVVLYEDGRHEIASTEVTGTIEQLLAAEPVPGGIARGRTA